MTEWKHSINSYVRTYDGESVKYFNGKFEFWGLKKGTIGQAIGVREHIGK